MTKLVRTGARWMTPRTASVDLAVAATVLRPTVTTAAWPPAVEAMGSTAISKERSAGVCAGAASAWPAWRSRRIRSAVGVLLSSGEGGPAGRQQPARRAPSPSPPHPPQLPPSEGTVLVTNRHLTISHIFSLSFGPQNRTLSV